MTDARAPADTNTDGALLPANAAARVPLDDADLETLQSARALLEGRSPGAAKALAQAQLLLDQGKDDLRVVVVALQARAIARPIEGAGEAATALARWLSERFDALDPAGDPRRAKQLASALGSLVDAIAATIHEASADTPALRQGATSTRAYWDAACGALDAAFRLRDLAPLAPRVQALRAAVETRLPAVTPESDGSDVERVVAPGTLTSLEAAPPALEPVRSRGPVATARGGGDVTLAASARFFELHDKLLAFGELVRNGDDAKASLVGTDLAKTLAAFDPTAYFPALFADFFADLAMVSSRVRQSPDLEEPAWAALYQLYRVDLERFMAAKAPAASGARSASRSASASLSGGLDDD